MTRPIDQFISVGTQGGGSVKVRYWESPGHEAPGPGSPILLLHGIGCSVLEWEHNIEVLGRKHRVIALDILGFGLTDKPADETYTMRRLAEFVLDFMTQLGISKASLIGNSMGGNIALQCAILAPDRVNRLVLIAPAGIGKETLINFRIASLPLLGEILTRPSRFGLGMLWRLAFVDKRFVTESMISEKVSLASGPGAQRAFLKTLRGFLNVWGFPDEQLSALHRALPKVHSPTLVIWGKQDKLLPANHAKILARLMPNVLVEIFEACGHVPQIEFAEQTNQKILNFMA